MQSCLRQLEHVGYNKLAPLARYIEAMRPLSQLAAAAEAVMQPDTVTIAEISEAVGDEASRKTILRRIEACEGVTIRVIRDGQVIRCDRGDVIKALRLEFPGVERLEAVAK